jgi:hypothetical protein
MESRNQEAGSEFVGLRKQRTWICRVYSDGASKPKSVIVGWRELELSTWLKMGTGENTAGREKGFRIA